MMYCLKKYGGLEMNKVSDRVLLGVVVALSVVVWVVVFFPNLFVS
jgi:hypothetical protein